MIVVVVCARALSLISVLGPDLQTGDMMGGGVIPLGVDIWEDGLQPLAAWLSLNDRVARRGVRAVDDRGGRVRAGAQPYLGARPGVVSGSAT